MITNPLVVLSELKLFEYIHSLFHFTYKEYDISEDTINYIFSTLRDNYQNPELAANIVEKDIFLGLEEGNVLSLRYRQYK